MTGWFHRSDMEVGEIGEPSTSGLYLSLLFY